MFVRYDVFYLHCRSAIFFYRTYKSVEASETFNFVTVTKLGRVQGTPEDRDRLIVRV